MFHKFFKPVFVIWVVFSVISAISNDFVVLGHEFEDGFVERTVNLVIRDDIATLELSVGMNPNTMQQIVTKWISASNEDSKSTQPPNAQKNSSADSDKEETESGIKQEWTEAEIAKLESQFRELMLKYLTPGLKVQFDGEKVRLMPVEIQATSKHHYNAIAKWQFEIEATESPVLLTVNDDTFAELHGAVRCAAKAYGDTLLTQSNVEPAIVRADRFELKGMPSKRRQQVQTIRCKLIFSDD